MKQSCLYFDKKYKCVSFIVHYTALTLTLFRVRLLMFGTCLLYYVIRAELHCEKCISKPFFRTKLYDFSSHLTHVRNNKVHRKD